MFEGGSMKFLELKEKYGIVMLDRFFADPVEMQCRETELLKLLLDLYHNEVDAHYNVEQFLKSNYEGKYAIPEGKEEQK